VAQQQAEITTVLPMAQVLVVEWVFKGKAATDQGTILHGTAQDHLEAAAIPEVAAELDIGEKTHGVVLVIVLTTFMVVPTVVVVVALVQVGQHRQETVQQAELELFGAQDNQLQIVHRLLLVRFQAPIPETYDAIIHQTARQQTN
jgi:hypothetical protein